MAELRRVHAAYGHGSEAAPALVGVDLEVRSGEILGVVGESGAGKSTLARCLLRLMPTHAGQVRLEDLDITTWSARRLRRLRARMTLVFPDPIAVLNPRHTVRRLIEEPLRLHARMPRDQRRAAGEAIAASVRLDPRELDQLPAALPTGRLQRACLARALATAPRLLVLDEPTALLDATSAAELLDLLAGLRAEGGPGIVITCADLGALRPVADRIAVLHLGRIVEQGPADQILRDPLHPYTQALLSAHLAADPANRGRRIRLRGETPPDAEPATGCGFAPRCPIAQTRCNNGAPTPNQVSDDHSVACVRVLEGTSRIPVSR